MNDGKKKIKSTEVTPETRDIRQAKIYAKIHEVNVSTYIRSVRARM